jgi:hypothetical protein
VFGETAVNYEEGKFARVNGEIVFLPEYNPISVQTGDMQAFADDDVGHGYHYGDYISGSAVRTDAALVFERIRNQVSVARSLRFSTYNTRVDAVPKHLIWKRAHFWTFVETLSQESNAWAS